MYLSTGDDISTKAMSLKRKNSESDVADANTKLGKLSKTQDPALTDDSTGQSRSNTQKDGT